MDSVTDVTDVGKKEEGSIIKQPMPNYKLQIKNYYL